MFRIGLIGVTVILIGVFLGAPAIAQQPEADRLSAAKAKMNDEVRKAGSDADKVKRASDQYLKTEEECVAAYYARMKKESDQRAQMDTTRQMFPSGKRSQPGVRPPRDPFVAPPTPMTH